MNDKNAKLEMRLVEDIMDSKFSLKKIMKVIGLMCVSAR